MKMKINGCTIETVKGDITKESVDAIVNAANESLRGGGGVDGAIHRAGGPEIMEGCKQYDGCPTGDAKPTTAGNLNVKHVIHAVGPRYKGGNAGEAELLASAYRRSLEVAAEQGDKSVAFPAISCGVYGYPLDEGAKIATETVRDFVKDNDTINHVRFVLFDDTTYNAFEQALEKAM